MENTAQDNQVLVTEGKVFFTYYGNIDKVVTLKIAERIFVQIFQKKTKRFQLWKGKSELGHLVRAVLQKAKWVQAYNTYASLNTSLNAKPDDDDNDDDEDISDEEETSATVCHTTAMKKPRLDRVDGAVRDTYQSDTHHGDHHTMALKPHHPPTFRVNCKCTGTVYPDKPQDVSRAIGWGAARMMSWSPDLKSPEMEICIHLNSELITVGISLTRRPLSVRPYLLHTGLRSTVAWTMARLATIQAGETVLDPMCGKGTVLVEAAMEWPLASYIGCDTSAEQISTARGNIDHSKKQSNISLLQAHCQALPLSSKSVNAIVCDAPFGQKYSSEHMNLREFYQTFLTEFDRVLTDNGRIILLTSQCLRHLIFKYCISSSVKEANFPVESPCDMLSNRPALLPGQHKSIDKGGNECPNVSNDSSVTVIETSVVKVLNKTDSSEDRARLSECNNDAGIGHVSPVGELSLKNVKCINNSNDSIEMASSSCSNKAHGRIDVPCACSSGSNVKPYSCTGTGCSVIHTNTMIHAQSIGASSSSEQGNQGQAKMKSEMKRNDSTISSSINTVISDSTIPKHHECGSADETRNNEDSKEETVNSSWTRMACSNAVDGPAIVNDTAVVQGDTDSEQKPTPSVSHCVAKVNWIVKSCHDLKLGETHACLLVFNKT